MGSGRVSSIESRETSHGVTYSSAEFCYEVEIATLNVLKKTSADPSIDIETHSASGNRAENIDE